MWNECKGFIALMAITLLIACLLIIGMLIHRESLNKDLPRLKPKEICMNVGVAPKAQKMQRPNHAYAQMAKIKNPNNTGFANLAPRSYSYSFAPYAKIMPETNLGVATKAKIRVYPKGTIILKSPEKKNESP